MAVARSCTSRSRDPGFVGVLDDEVNVNVATTSALTMKIVMNLIEKLSRTNELIHHPA